MYINIYLQKYRNKTNQRKKEYKQQQLYIYIYMYVYTKRFHTQNYEMK